MKKPNFKKIALMGMAGGLIAVTQAVAGNAITQETTLAAKGCGGGKCGGRASCGSPVQRNRYTAYNDDQDQSTTITAKKLTDSELMSQLNAEGKATYQSLSPEGKALALKLANQSCKGQNDCKGQNSCKSDKNSCAGRGSCAGTTKGPFTDKNVAVKVAAMKMAEKRGQMNSSKADNDTSFNYRR